MQWETPVEQSAARANGRNMALLGSGSVHMEGRHARVRAVSSNAISACCLLSAMCSIRTALHARRPDARLFGSCSSPTTAAHHCRSCLTPPPPPPVPSATVPNLCAVPGPGEGVRRHHLPAVPASRALDLRVQESAGLQAAPVSHAAAAEPKGVQFSAATVQSKRAEDIKAALGYTLKVTPRKSTE